MTSDAPPAPGLTYDDDAVRCIEARLSRLEEDLEAAWAALSGRGACDSVQTAALRLRDDAAMLAADVARLHLETCIDRVVRAGEATLAVRSLREAFRRFLG